ncbi:Ig-like domain-containing protein, partial [Arthrospiribacter ruber]
SANSETVSVTVFETPENILPLVSITAPAAGTEIEAGQTISITADASDEDGEVVKVEFFVNGTSIGSVTQAPYSISWTADEAGTFYIRAVATDNEGASANSETVSVTVFETPENILPTVSITAPSTGTEIEAGETISITADASDEDGEVVKVEFFVNGSSIGISNEAPYSINWTADETGTFEIRAVATDNEGASANSETVSVTVFETPENILPLVSITAPAAGTEIEAGQTISITADASDEDGEVVKVEFFVNGTSIGSATQAPYSINWTADEAGTFEIRATATDNDGASANSETVSVTVFETPENILPTVSITAPAQGTEIEAGETISITADASDEDGEVVKVEFFVNGSSIGTTAQAPYSINWTADEAGTFEIRAVATDNEGASANSETVSVTVFETPENILPTVSITAPAQGTEIEAGETISITADASDEDGEVVKVEFFVNGSSIGTTAQAPYSINWTADEAGTFDIRAVATDNEGASANSEIVTVTVFETPENILPKVSITAPSTGTEIEAGSTVTITADAFDEDGEVVKVEFFVNGSSIGTTTQAPYSINWTADEAGTFEIRALATDNDGASSNSQTVTVTVFESVKPLAIKIVSPAQNEVFARNTNIQFEVEIEGQSQIEKVEYFRNNILIGTGETETHSLLWRAMNLGNQNIRATVTDIEGQTATSEILRIRVENNFAPEVRLLSPFDNEEFIVDTPIQILAEAFDSDGYIDYVEFYANGNLIGVSYEDPFFISWTNTIPGTYILTAKAFDDKGASTVSVPISIVVKEGEPKEQDEEGSDSTKVNVMFVSPGDNQEFTHGTLVPLIIMFEGDLSLVNKVEFYANGTLIGVSNEDPYNFDWLAGMTGKVELIAVAYDIDNKEISISEPRFIQIIEAQRTFRIIDPIRDAVFVAGSDILIRVELPIEVKEINKVEFFRGNQKIGESTTEPYSFVWENVSQGQYNLVARLVYKDGSSELSLPIRISVSPRNSGNIRIKASKKEVVEGDSFELQVETNDLSQMIDLIDVYMNDELLEQLDEQPYSVKIEELPVGEYKFVARGKSKNSKGQVYYSEEVTVRVIPKRLEGIDMPDILLEIKIGPNPASEYLNLIFENLGQDEQYDFTVQIVSMNGVVHDIYSFTQEGKVSTLDISNLKNGVYMMNLFYKNRQIESKRFIKRR